MEQSSNTGAPGSSEPRCECGYLCTGATLEARVRDGQRHARAEHGIDVSLDQVLSHDRAATAEGVPE